MNGSFLTILEKTTEMLSSSLMQIFSTNNLYNTQVLDSINNNYVVSISDEICPFNAYSIYSVEEFRISEIRCGFGAWLVLNERSGTSLYIEEVSKFIYKGVEYVNPNYS